MADQPTARRRSRILVGCAVASLLMLSAAPALAHTGSDHSSKKAMKGMKGMKGMDHSKHGMVTIDGALTGDSPCEKSGPPASVGQVKKDAEGHDKRGPLVQYSVSRADRQKLIDQQRQARAVADKYPTVASAEAGGYRKSTVYVPCIGAHYTNTGYVAKFDPSNPSELLYEGTAPDAKIVGLSYLLLNKGGAPEGFAGPNDQWHQHNANGGLCLNPQGVVVGAESTSVKDCVARGGKKVPLDDIWMVHDWVVPGWECGWGVFAGECPELGGRIGGTVFDKPDPKSFKKALDGKGKTTSTKKSSHKSSPSAAGK